MIRLQHIENLGLRSRTASGFVPPQGCDAILIEILQP